MKNPYIVDFVGVGSSDSSSEEAKRRTLFLVQGKLTIYVASSLQHSAAHFGIHLTHTLPAPNLHLRMHDRWHA
jgi:hypothetical protein